MANIEKRTISLPAEHAAYVDAKVASGEYASVSEVVRDGLRSLQARDAAIEKWLREEVVPTVDRLKNGLERTYSSEEVREKIQTRLAEFERRKQ